jgi:hypothetical protein
MRILLLSLVLAAVLVGCADDERPRTDGGGARAGDAAAERGPASPDGAPRPDASAGGDDGPASPRDAGASAEAPRVPPPPPGDGPAQGRDAISDAPDAARAASDAAPRPADAASVGADAAAGPDGSAGVVDAAAAAPDAEGPASDAPIAPPPGQEAGAAADPDAPAAVVDTGLPADAPGPDPDAAAPEPDAPAPAAEAGVEPDAPAPAAEAGVEPDAPPAVFDAGGGADAPAADPCEGLRCGGLTVCAVTGGRPRCVCPPGSVEVGATCIPCTAGLPATIDVPRVLLSGGFLVNGSPAPASEYEDGNIFLRNLATNDEIRVGPTDDQSYRSLRVLPGVYDVFYDFESGGTLVPINKRAVVKTVEIQVSGTLGVDVPMVSLSGTFTISGQPPPGSVYESGRIWLRNPATGDEVLLGGTNAATYSLKVVAGEYDVVYRHFDGGALVPVNPDAWLKRVTIPKAAAFALDVDVPMASVGGAITIAGAAPPVSPYESGQIVFEGRLATDRVTVAGTDAGSYARKLVAQSYKIHYKHLAGTQQVPINKWALLKTADVTGSMTVNVDVPMATVSGRFTIAGQPPPTAATDSAEVYLNNTGTGDVARLGLTHEATHTSKVGSWLSG